MLKSLACTIALFLGVAAADHGFAAAETRALEVKGSAGHCTDVWWDGQYHATNRCGRKVKVHLGPWSALVNPGQTHDFGPVRSFIGDVSSEYAD